MSYLSETNTGYLIFGVIFLFILQEVLIRNYISEPYPALRMPGFSANRINEAGHYEISSLEIEILFTDSNHLHLPASDFFYDAPTSHHRHLSQRFLPADKSEDNAVYKQIDFLESIIPGLFISRNRSRYELQHHPETIQWLKHQINGIEPSSFPEKIKFHWYKNQYNPNNLSDMKRELTSTHTLVLK